MEQKKGIQLNQAFGAVLTVVLVAVLVIIAIFIFVNLATSFDGISSVTVVNESLTPTTAGTAVSAATLCGFGDLAVTSAVNGSTGPTIGTGNYSVQVVNGTITNLTSEFVDVPWNITYTYTWGSEACTASENLTTEFSNYTSLIGLVGTIIFLGLVIGVLVASFVFSGSRRV
ncbi:MAG: hypothetical protein ACTSQ4_02140 [Candidatus Heimdallarchaeaceae archaeon]